MRNIQVKNISYLHNNKSYKKDKIFYQINIKNI